ncbi:PilZ domain-containing protein [Mariprofundus erugo]|uniref:PilZ domain-containing protein n=1 Tax=Mariprofundus erugo TaxID=2528639 RepID=A0A5R9GUU0_9PROT|nr:PilZ domain-containing protein [Mariprofundus erugo]TLS68609.1 PilZ domain-containing protein [Mariprofundus erugo]
MTIQHAVKKTAADHRLPVSALVVLHDGEAFEARVLDLSMKGVFLDSPAMTPVGSCCQVTIYFGRHHHELPVVARCTVARADAHSLALRFDSLALDGHVRLDPFEHGDHPVMGESEQVAFSRHGGWIFSP